MQPFDPAHALPKHPRPHIKTPSWRKSHLHRFKTEPNMTPRVSRTNMVNELEARLVARDNAAYADDNDERRLDWLGFLQGRGGATGMRTVQDPQGGASAEVEVRDWLSGEQTTGQ
jgi:hypothetical protein